MSEKKRPKAKLVFIAALGGSLLFVSPQLYDHLGKWESGNKLTLTVYADKLANGIPTVCHGMTRHVTKTPIIVGETWTEEKCLEEEGRAIEKVQHQVVKCLQFLPPEDMWNMISSHAWNFGAPTTCKSGFLRELNAGNWEKGCERIATHADGRPAWSYSNGKFYPGLQNRRQDEYKICLRSAMEVVR